MTRTLVNELSFREIYAQKWANCFSPVLFACENDGISFASGRNNWVKCFFWEFWSIHRRHFFFFFYRRLVRRVIDFFRVFRCCTFAPRINFSSRVRIKTSGRPIGVSDDARIVSPPRAPSFRLHELRSKNPPTSLIRRIIRRIICPYQPKPGRAFASRFHRTVAILVFSFASSESKLFSQEVSAE